MDDMKTQEGIDFFDFLYEIWQAKWLFLLIVLICTGIAAAGALLRNNYTTFKSVEQTTAQFRLNLRHFSDPYQRNAGLLMGDLVGLLDPDGTFGLQYTDPGNPADYVEPVHGEIRRFEFRYVGQIGVGYIVLNFQDQDETKYQSIHGEFLRAAEQQFRQAKEFAEGIVDGYKRMEQYSREAAYQQIPDQVVLALGFLETPSVKDGTFRFFDFKPLEVRTTETNIATSSSQSLLKNVLLGIIIGFILACVTMMFRIAIKSKKLGESRV